jgi:hypothetical protein
LVGEVSNERGIERIAVGQIHSKAWEEAGPQKGWLCLHSVTAWKSRSWRSAGTYC